jgi:hypothetical protein
MKKILFLASLLVVTAAPSFAQLTVNDPANLAQAIKRLESLETQIETPSPLLGGYSFSEVIPRTAFGMADLVGTTTQQQMLAKLNDIMNGIQSMSEFSLLHARDFIVYLLITLLIAVLELAMFIVVGFGYLALGAVLTIGPILIPFMLVPKLDFLFWSWLKALIKYSFYPVVGNIILMGISQIMLSVLNTTALSQGVTAGGVVVSMTQIPILAVVFLAGIYSTFKIPSLVGDIFSGAANAGTGVQQAVSGAVAAAIF